MYVIKHKKFVILKTLVIDIVEFLESLKPIKFINNLKFPYNIRVVPCIIRVDQNEGLEIQFA